MYVVFFLILTSLYSGSPLQSLLIQFPICMLTTYTPCCPALTQSTTLTPPTPIRMTFIRPPITRAPQFPHVSVTRDHVLGLETGRHTDHAHLQALSRNAVSALSYPSPRTTMRLSFHFTHPRFPFRLILLFLSSLSLHPRRPHCHPCPHEALPPPLLKTLL